MPTTPMNSYISLSAAPLTMPEVYSCQDINYMVERLEKQNADLKAEMKLMQQHIDTITNDTISNYSSDLVDLSYDEFDTEDLLRMKSEIEEELSKRNIARL